MTKKARAYFREWTIFLLLVSTWWVDPVSGSTKDFISLDCGLATTSAVAADPQAHEKTDQTTGIPWLPDSVKAYNSEAMTLGNISEITVTNKDVDNEMAMSTFRYFPVDSPSARKKYCYEMTVLTQRSYLIRVGFYVGSSNGVLVPPVEFDVSINSNVVYKLDLNDSNSLAKDQQILQEFIWRTDTSNVLHVCLIPRTGTAFISSLELRLLDEQTYSDIFNGGPVYLRKVMRYDCGSMPTAPNIRYANDVYDRIWSSGPPEGMKSYSRISTATQFASEDTKNKPPAPVMESACTDSNEIRISTSVARFHACLYFQEVSNSGPDRSRVVSLKDSPSIPEQSVTVLRNNFTQFCYDGRDLMNLTLTKAAGSRRDPILNAAEVYEVTVLNDSAIAPDDASVIDAVKISLPLADWRGDPCYPVSYDWIVCDMNSKVITLNLSGQFSSQNILSIPYEIGSLDQLQELYLDHNSLEGRIPDSFSRLNKLQVLQLSNNNLRGELPEFLSSLPALKELNLDNNFFTGVVRTSLLNSGIHVSFANNPSLCVEGSQNCSTPNQKSSSKTPYWIVGLAAGIGALILILVTLLLCFICPGCCLYKARRRSLSRMHSSRGDVHPIHVGAGSSAGRLIPSVDNEAYTKKLEQDFWNAGLQLSSLQIPPPSKASSIRKDPSTLSKQSSLHITPSMSASQPSASRRRHSADLRGIPIPLGSVAPSPPSSSKEEVVTMSPGSSKSKQREFSVATSAPRSPKSSQDDNVQFKVYSVEEIQHITRNYESLIGEGPTGQVYHGMLYDRTDVAVKIQDDRSLHSTAFVKKVKALAKIAHKNLVPVMGYCSENNKRMVVYQFLTNGTLQEKLRGERGVTRILDWATRVKILYDAAQGMEYLHTEFRLPKAHGNVKSSNIFLDENCLAKLGDYGLADSPVSTPGYMDPAADYSDTSKRIKLEQDVFSFGVVMLETITGLAPTHMTTLEDHSERSLLSSFRIAIKTGNLEDMVDPKLRATESVNMESVWSVAGIAFSCLEPRLENRPQMTRVITQLRKALDVLE
ncbi:hypothetical protein MPTK1_2g04150 [Marchantia polymorpha subsp. ruderalis]|uniref:non-specific serine/threonine protein kinase n=1 Tax=Marchantia polymorpha TaxID=3197 RepID=A0A2R6X7L5_MARPO|nr:hypothetical protein MARPO_0031s0071 [Marchantia polymorpha]PTQ42097.1 hypothetical protein MARPO_0031s0071 [Marchantia polymorpha]BBN01047.1 hypothetical protein Mp_2g04150 [Marchantia polymorpha subsp. ruderalis]BBN01048.1 hypothetical protein Mp_2g04150 [Marchantia polymorpha subsp. ruderalis]|eukprot:PTQ42096.1 hypothetical protein MARPO_0031s0071 [Marchantia polymorpha]